MAKTRVYRSGVLHPPAARGCEAASYRAADDVRPEGHPSRTDAIFASPALPGVARWVRGNAMVGSADVNVREITVNPDEVMVYNVAAWERASSRETPEAYAAFWATGMPLTDWQAADLDPEAWEALLTAESILRVRPVSAARVVAAAPAGWDGETKRALARKYGYSAR